MYILFTYVVLSFSLNRNFNVHVGVLPLLKRSILWLKYIMKGIGCKIFIVQFAFIVFIYGIGRYSLLLSGKQEISDLKMNHYYHCRPIHELLSFSKSQIWLTFLYNLNFKWDFLFIFAVSRSKFSFKLSLLSKIITFPTLLI